MATSRRAALYVRVSTADRGQTAENQLQPLQEAAGRLGWTVVAIGQDAVRHVGRIQRVRAGDNPRSGAGGTGSRSIIRQAVGQAENDAVPGTAYQPPRCPGLGAWRRPRSANSPESALRTRCFSVRNGRAMLHGRAVKQWQRLPERPTEGRTMFASIRKYNVRRGAGSNSRNGYGRASCP
jgi:hypothetical protein